MELVYIALALSAALIAFVFLREARKGRLRQMLLSSPMPAGWAEILRRNVPLYTRLSEIQRQRLGGYMNAFVTEKNFEPCGDLEEVTEEMMITIAGQACMLLLSGRHGVFDRLKTVLLYPDIFVGEVEVDEDGMERADQGRLGESWGTGSVVLSWHHVLHGPGNDEDGQNVVLHEFAHQLDQIDGSADGAPLLGSAAEYREWAGTFSTAFDRHRSRTSRRRRLVIDEYGATNPAEFFAVATETFFEKPKQLHARYPDLYDQLKRFYALDPLQW